MKKKRSTLTGELIETIAPKIGARVLREPAWGLVGQITFKSGRRRYFKYSSIDINSLASSEIAKDKDYANFFMESMGYPVTPGKAFYSKEWAKAIGAKQTTTDPQTYAAKLGFPVFVKPNSGSQGRGVQIAETKAELKSALKEIFEKDKVALIQKLLHGNDYRVVVLDSKIISAYQRIPLNVIGDGKNSIAALLRKKQKEFANSGRDTKIWINDERIAKKLERDGLTLKSVPALNQQVFLLDNANLSTGGDSIDVTRDIHPDFKKIAIQLTKDMGLRLCGVDLMVKGSISDAPKKYWILEINASPGLDHYAKSGKEQAEIVEKLYTEVLKQLDTD